MSPRRSKGRQGIKARSTSLQSMEARIIMDLRRARCARSRSPSPPAPEIVASPLQLPLTSTANIEKSPRAEATPLFRPKNEGAASSSIGGPVSPMKSRLASPDLASRRSFKGTRLGNSFREPPASDGDGYCSSERQATCGSGDSATQPAADEQRKEQEQPIQHQHHQQHKQTHLDQQPSCALLHERISSEAGGGDKGVGHHTREPISASTKMRTATMAASTPFGSKGYLEKRRERRALGEHTVRQLGQGREMIDALVKGKAAKVSQDLQRWLAANRKQMVSAAVDTNANGDRSPSALDEIEKEKQRDKLETSTTERASGIRPEWRPWGEGKPQTCWGKERKRYQDKRHSKSTTPVTTISAYHELVKAHARVTVERIIRRACLNLINRPWRLAGVRLSTDSPSGKRRRTREMAVRRVGTASGIAKGASDAVRGNAATRETTPQLYRQIPASRTASHNPMEYGGGRGPRRLVRRQRPFDGDSLDIGEPSPPPLPQQRRPPPSSVRRSGRGSIRRGGDNESGDTWQDDSRDCASDGDHVWHAATLDNKIGFEHLSCNTNDKREDSLDHALFRIEGECGQSEMASTKTEDVWVPGGPMPEYRDTSGEFRENRGGAKARRWSGDSYCRAPFATPYCRTESRVGLYCPQTSDSSSGPESTRRYRPRSKRAEREAACRGAPGRRSLGRHDKKCGSEAVDRNRARPPFPPRYLVRSRRHHLGKRPRWNSRFWLPNRDPATTAVPQTEAPLERSRSLSPRREPRPKAIDAGLPSGAAGVARVATATLGLRFESPRDSITGRKLAELKEENVLCEIGRQRYFIGSPMGEMEIILSELCTVFIGRLPHLDVKRPTFRRETEVSEHSDDAVPRVWDTPREDKLPAELGDVDVWSGREQGEREEDEEDEVTAVPASRGLLLELIRVPGKRPAECGKQESRQREPAGLSLTRSRTTVKQVAPSTAPARPGTFAAYGGQSIGRARFVSDECCLTTTPSTRYRPQTQSQHPATVPGRGGLEYTGHRLDTSFLVLTLGFLRRLVEKTAQRNSEQSVVADDSSAGGISLDSRHDERLLYRDGPERVSVRQHESLSKAPVPPWLHLAAALDSVRVFDAEQGVHGRLVEDMRPTISQLLLQLIARTFQPPPGIRRRYKNHNGNDHIGKAGRNIHRELGSYLGLAVRNLLRSKSGSSGSTVVANPGFRHRNREIIGGDASDADGVQTFGVSVQSAGQSLDAQRRYEPSRSLSNATPVGDADQASAAMTRPTCLAGAARPTAGQGEEAAGDISSVVSGVGYSTGTFSVEDSSLPSVFSTQGASATTLHTYEERVDQFSSSSVETNCCVNEGSFGEESAGLDPLADEGELAAGGKDIFYCPSRSKYCRLPYPRGSDLAVLAEMQRANDHTEFPGLGQDARMLADALGRLAEGSWRSSTTTLAPATFEG